MSHDFEEEEHRATIHRLNREVDFQRLVVTGIYIMVALLYRIAPPDAGSPTVAMVDDFDRWFQEFMKRYIKGG